jgi:hypothetical protein
MRGTWHRVIERVPMDIKDTTKNGNQIWLFSSYTQSNLLSVLTGKQVLSVLPRR